MYTRRIGPIQRQKNAPASDVRANTFARGIPRGPPEAPKKPTQHNWRLKLWVTATFRAFILWRSIFQRRQVDDADSTAHGFLASCRVDHPNLADLSLRQKVPLPGWQPKAGLSCPVVTEAACLLMLPVFNVFVLREPGSRSLAKVLHFTPSLPSPPEQRQPFSTLTTSG
jgi:hypothetical protein